MKFGLRRSAVIILAVIIIGLLGISAYTGHQVVLNSTQLSHAEDPFQVRESFLESFHVDYAEFTARYVIEKVTLTSTLDGHQIPADYICAESPCDRDHDTVVMVHGLGGNRTTVYHAAQVFLENGYNVLAYDQRSSGENTAPHTTFGYLEKYDLRDCVNAVKDWAPEKKLGVWGTSFGGITSVLAVCDTSFGVAAHTDFLVLDSPVSNMEDELRQTMDSEDMGGIPTDYLILTGNIMNKLELGFTYKEADGRNIIRTRMEETDMPLLVIICSGDDVTPWPMGADLYELYKGGNKTLLSLEGSAHASAWRDYEAEYREAVGALLGSLN